VVCKRNWKSKSVGAALTGITGALHLERGNRPNGPPLFCALPGFHRQGISLQEKSAAAVIVVAASTAEQQKDDDPATVISVQKTGSVSAAVSESVPIAATA
jgi:hypothetical protein